MASPVWGRRDGTGCPAPHGHHSISRLALTSCPAGFSVWCPQQDVPPGREPRGESVCEATSVPEMSPFRRWPLLVHIAEGDETQQQSATWGQGEERDV